MSADVTCIIFPSMCLIADSVCVHVRTCVTFPELGQQRASKVFFWVPRLVKMASGSRASSWERVMLSPPAPSSSGYPTEPRPELIPFSQKDKELCIDLVTKGILLGDGEEIWSEAVQAFRNRRDYYKREGLWDDVCAQYQAYRAKNDGGTMADSSKRQRSSDHVTAPGTPPPRAGNRELLTPSTMMMAASTTGPRTSPPRGPPVPRPVHEPVPVPRDVLPRDVQTLEQWGLTKITFGKYASKNLAYKDLVNLRDRESSSYIKWCIPRAKTGGEALADLAKYLSVLKDKKMLPSPPTSPASSTTSTWTRRYRDHSPNSLTSLR